MTTFKQFVFDQLMAGLSENDMLECQQDYRMLEPSSADFPWEQFFFDMRYAPGFQCVYKRDLKAVAFELDNIIFNYADPLTGEATNFYDYQGREFVLLGAGGDWEYPVSFILYQDSHGLLRAYIPPSGNYYNAVAGAAYGNHESDSTELARQGFSEPEDLWTQFNASHRADAEKLFTTIYGMLSGH